MRTAPIIVNAIKEARKLPDQAGTDMNSLEARKGKVRAYRQKLGLDDSETPPDQEGKAEKPEGKSSSG